MIWRGALLSVLLVLSGAACTKYAAKPLDGRAILAEIRGGRARQPSDALDPDEAVALALLNNPELRAFRLQRNVAAGRVVSARAWENPELRLDLQAPLRLAFALRIMPPIPGERAAKIEGARAYERRVLAEIEDRENRLAAETRIAHARALMLEEKIRLLDASLELHDRIAAIVDQRVAQLGATELDRALTRLNRFQIEAERDAAVLAREAALVELAGHLGIVAGSIEHLKEGRAQAAPVGRQSDLEDKALLLRPDLRMLKETYEEREQELHLAYLARAPWPRFLQPGVKKIPDKVTIDMEAAIPIPIFDDKGPIQVAEARREMARAEYEARIAEIRGEIHSALARIAEEDRRRRWFHERVEPVLADAERLVNAAFSAGELDAVKISFLAERVLEARRKAVDAELDFAIAIIKLDLAAGTVLDDKSRPPRKAN